MTEENILSNRVLSVNLICLVFPNIKIQKLWDKINNFFVSEFHINLIFY